MEDNNQNITVTPADTPAESKTEVTKTAAKAAEAPAADTKEKSRFARFLNRKNIVISGKRYGIDALGAMAQGLFASLLIGLAEASSSVRPSMEEPASARTASFSSR